GAGLANIAKATRLSRLRTARRCCLISSPPARWLRRLSEKGTGLLKSCKWRLSSRRIQESCPLFGQSPSEKAPNRAGAYSERRGTRGEQFWSARGPAYS